MGNNISYQTILAAKAVTLSPWSRCCAAMTAT